MNILICVKQVPCVEKMKYDELTQTVLRQKDDLMLNPFDASTIEQALTLKQKYPSVHFTIMSMGTMHAKAMLKELLAYDIDRAVLLSDPVFAGSDTLATGYVLSKGIRCAGDYDLIFCGKQSTDGDTGQVGPSLAQKLGIPHLTNVIVPLVAVVLGEELLTGVKELFGYGADFIYCIQTEGEPLNDIEISEVLVQIISKDQPGILLIGSTIFGRSVAPRVASMLDAGLTADCTQLDIREKDGRLLQTRPAFSGEIMATIVTHSTLQIVTVRPGRNEIGGFDQQHRGQIIPCRVWGKRSGNLQLIHRFTKSGESITQCRDVIIAVGRGASDRQSLYLIEQLAKMMHASIGCSRAVVDAGVLDARFQIGQTGQIVRPKLYLAFGISGASQHIVGMRDAKVVVAVNRNPDAPIFKYAHYKVVADVTEFIPCFIDELRRAIDGGIHNECQPGYSKI